MSGKTKAIIALLVVLIIATISFLGYTYAKPYFQGSNYASSNQSASSTNTTAKIENKVENKVVEEKKEEPKEEKEPVKEEQKQEAQPEPNSEVQSISDEEKAISIVKKDWGDTEGMTFRVEQINGDGSYVISVRNGDSLALEWYTVYPKTGKFTK